MGASSSHLGYPSPSDQSFSYWRHGRQGRVSSYREEEESPFAHRIHRTRSLNLDQSLKFDRRDSLTDSNLSVTDDDENNDVASTFSSPDNSGPTNRRLGGWGKKPSASRLRPSFLSSIKAPANNENGNREKTASNNITEGGRKSSLRHSGSLPKDFKVSPDWLGSLPNDFQVSPDWLSVAPPENLSPPQTPHGPISALHERVTSRLRGRLSQLKISSLEDHEQHSPFSASSPFLGIAVPSPTSSSTPSSISSSSSFYSPSSLSSGLPSPYEVSPFGENECNLTPESAESPYSVLPLYAVKKDPVADVAAMSANREKGWESSVWDSEDKADEDKDEQAEEEKDGDDEREEGEDGEDMAFYHQQLQLYHVRFPTGVDRSTCFKWQPKLESIVEFDIGKQGQAQVLARRRSLGSADMREVLAAVEEASKMADRDSLPSLLKMQQR